MTAGETSTMTRTPPHRTTIAKGLAAGIGLALVANIAVFVIGSVGAPLRVVATDTAPG